MAALTATVGDPKLISFGNLKAMTYRVTASGSAGHVVTGLKYIWFATTVPETASSTATTSLVLNSNDGTADTLKGSVYIADAQNATDVVQLLVIGW